MYLNQEINEKYLWKKFRRKELHGWLGFAFLTQSDEMDRENVKVFLDGNLFDCFEGFYCTLGEEVNGPGGYFGRNGNALDDCFYRGFGVKSMSEVTWKNHERSKNY